MALGACAVALVAGVCISLRFWSAFVGQWRPWRRLWAYEVVLCSYFGTFLAGMFVLNDAGFGILFAVFC